MKRVWISCVGAGNSPKRGNVYFSNVGRGWLAPAVWCPFSEKIHARPQGLRKFAKRVFGRSLHFVGEIHLSPADFDVLRNGMTVPYGLIVRC